MVSVKKHFGAGIQGNLPFQRWTLLCVRKRGRPTGRSCLSSPETSQYWRTDAHTHTHPHRVTHRQVHRGTGRTSRSTYPECVFHRVVPSVSKLKLYTLLYFFSFILQINAIHWWTWSDHRRKHERARKEGDPGRGGYSLRLCWWVTTLLLTTWLSYDKFLGCATFLVICVWKSLAGLKPAHQGYTIKTVRIGEVCRGGTHWLIVLLHRSVSA